MKKDDISSSFDLNNAAMRYSTQVKPISYLKANAAQVLLQLAEQREPLALLKLLALGNQEIEAGRIKPVGDVVARLCAKAGC